MNDDDKPVGEITFAYHGEIGPLFEALAKAQAEFPVLEKSRTVQVRSDKGNYSFDYATLDDLQQATRPILSKCGLCLLQPFHGAPGAMRLVTILGHSSGARIEATISLTGAPNVQALGSQLTYMKRYALKSLLCINDGEDDDGNQASGNQAEMAPRKQAPAPQQRREPPAPKAEVTYGHPSKPEPKPAPAPKAAPKAPDPELPAPVIPEEPFPKQVENVDDVTVCPDTWAKIHELGVNKLNRSNPALFFLCRKHTCGRWSTGDPRAVMTEAEGRMLVKDIESMPADVLAKLLVDYPRATVKA